MEIINWGIVKHPINWLTILLMLIIAGAAIHLVIGNRPAPVQS